MTDRSVLTTRRNGFTIVELMATMVLLGAVVVTAAPLLGWISAVHRSSMQRQMALGEATNILERLSVRPWETMTTEAVALETISQSTSRHLKQSKLTITVTDVEAPLPAKRINLSLTWKNRVNDSLAPIRLTTWIYRHEETP